MTKVNVGLEAVLNTYYDCVGCKNCELHRLRPSNDVLAGFGSSSADIMIITDAPSLTDYENKELLGDENGRLLMNMLEMVWFDDDKEMDKIRDLYGEDYFYELREYLSKHIFFTTVVACPIEDKVKVSDAQAKACRQRIFDLIYAVDPLIIIGLGDIPKKWIFGMGGQVKNKRGIVKDFKVQSPFSTREVRYSAITTYHPRLLSMVGDQNLVEQKRGLTYESMQDITKALEIVKTHREIQDDN